MITPGITVVTSPTRLQGMLNRWSTRGQAKFQLQRNRVIEFSKRAGPTSARNQEALNARVQEIESLAVADFDELESEDEQYQQVLNSLKSQLSLELPVHVIDRSFLANYNFANTSVVVVMGQDGLVANTAKYVAGLPIVAVNPDPARIDGVLLPFRVNDARRMVQKVLRRQAVTRSVTLAQASLHDGQRLLAFNDLFIGVRSHVSARYQLTVANQTEQQSSSGVLISTGAGSTGWLSSMINMANGLCTFLNPAQRPAWSLPLRWEDRQLVWIVREPFISKSSTAQLTAGRLGPGEELVIESQIPADGVVFSDGVEQDFLSFTNGSIVTIRVAQETAQLVVP